MLRGRSSARQPSVLDRKAADIARAAGAPMLAESSIKKALDLEWSDPEQKAGAVMTVVEQLDAFEAWVGKHMPAEAKVPPLSGLLATLRQLRDQDLEPDPSGGGSRIRQGVAAERHVSVEDGNMRHGRKSKSFNGYKRHIAVDLDTELIPACAITPANRPEEEATPDLQVDLARLPHRSEIESLHIDRGYIGSSLVEGVLARRGEVLCKPWVARNRNLFTKADQIGGSRRRSRRSRPISSPSDANDGEKRRSSPRSYGYIATSKTANFGASKRSANGLSSWPPSRRGSSA